MGLSPNGQGPKRNGRPTKDNKCTKTYMNRGLKCPQSKYKKLVLSKVATNEGKHQDHDQKREQVVMMDQTRRKRPQRHSPKPVHQPQNHSTRVEFPRRDLERQVSFFFLVSRRASKAECNTKAPILQQRTRTQDHITERHRTVHYKLTCLSMGAQACQKSPG